MNELLQISQTGEVLEGLRVDVQQSVGLFNSTVKEGDMCKLLEQQEVT